MPRGKQSSNVVDASISTLTLDCPCGRSYEGRPGTATKLYEMHAKLCPVAQEWAGIDFERETVRVEKSGRTTSDVSEKLLHRCLPIWVRID